jgi:hypothetical protein
MQCTTGLPGVSAAGVRGAGAADQVSLSINGDVGRRGRSSGNLSQPVDSAQWILGVDAMWDRPPGLSAAGVRGAGAADQVSSPYERRRQSARVLSGNLSQLVDSALLHGGFLRVRLARGPKRVHTSGGRSLAGTSLAAETFAAQYEKSRLKAGCSQDWLPHKELRVEDFFGGLFAGAYAIGDADAAVGVAGKMQARNGRG